MNKKVLLVSGLMVLLGGFFVYEKFVTVPQNQTPIINDNQTQISGNNPPPQTVTNNPPPATTAPQPASTGFKNGTFTGDTIQSMYGPVQAQVVIKSGKIISINFLQYPNDRSASSRKSQMAMPVIKQEVIQSQSANVNTVSGATETSYSFIQSISSALGQAS
jgi:uncharacterized protein with FMN-binding domain